MNRSKILTEVRKLLLLALQSGALRRSAYRDFQSIPYISTYGFWAFKPVYTKAFRPVSGSMWKSMVKLIMADLNGQQQATMGNNGKQWKTMDNNPRCFMHLWCRFNIKCILIWLININDHMHCTTYSVQCTVYVGKTKTKVTHRLWVQYYPQYFQLIVCLDIWLDTRQAVIGAETSNGSKGCFHKNFAPNFPAHMMSMFKLTIYHCSAEVEGFITAEQKWWG